MDVVTRAAALARVCEEIRGSAAEPPVPLAIACRMHGVSELTVRDMLQRGEAPEVEQARAAGHALAVRKACGDGPDARQWAWLAERLAPKELHLPNRVLSGQDPDAAPVEHRVTVDIADARQLARGVVQVLPAEPKRLR